MTHITGEALVSEDMVANTPLAALAASQLAVAAMADPPGAERRPVLSAALDQYRREIDKIPILTAEREAELVARLSYDETARDELVYSQLRLAASLVYSRASLLRALGYRLDDAVAEANIALLRAAEKFEPARGVPFTAFVSTVVRNHINSVVINQRPHAGDISLRRGAAWLHRLNDAFREHGGLWPSVETLAEVMGRPAGYVQELWDVPTVTSLEGYVRMHGEAGMNPMPWQQELLQPDRIGERPQDLPMAQWLNDLPEDQRIAVVMHFGLDGGAYSFTEIGARIGVSRETARKVLATALVNIRKAADLRPNGDPK